MKKSRVRIRKRVYTAPFAIFSLSLFLFQCGTGTEYPRNNGRPHLTGSGCVENGSQNPLPGENGSENFRVSGKIAVTGNDPFLDLILRAKEGVYILVGNLKKEIWGHQGRKVEVIGKKTEEKGLLPSSKGTITVKCYRILDE